MKSLEVALLYLRQLKAHNLKQIHDGRGRVVYTVLTDDFFIYVDEKVILEEHVADDWEHIDQDQGQDCRQDDGPAVASHRPDHIQQSFFSVHHIQQLENQSHVQEPMGETREL